MFINFNKMHGLGNDFVVIELITQAARLRPAHLQRIADRRLGIGCDQILLLEPPIRGSADFYLRIFNPTGEEVEQCGNGTRCAARFFYDMGFGANPHIEADCLAGPLSCIIEQYDRVTVNMGFPNFTASEEPLSSLLVAKDLIPMSILSLGNPHAVIQVPDLENAPIQTWGPLISTHNAFPQGTNVGFMQVIARNQIRLSVYERGVGQTLACGSGACAAVIAGIRLGLLDESVSVVFPKGRLHITWQGPNHPVFMTGPTTSVFMGRFRV
jgi:diaminopimelate epimerase